MLIYFLCVLWSLFLLYFSYPGLSVQGEQQIFHFCLDKKMENKPG